jgi:serine/threonine protein kinase
VQVYDFNNDNGVYYMVLEFIAGETLQERMKRLSETGRQFPVEDVVKFTSQISDAVGFAHQRGLVHRDIKPANIMLDVQGQAILMDFGIVKILGGDAHTSTGAVVGTARYMSPEIIRGEVADHRADIYSLGVTMYEMLSGRPPFVADSAMTLMMMHLNDPIPNVRSFRQEIPEAFIRILEKCLAKDRNDRYQSAAELSADLRRALTSAGDQTSIGAAQAPQLHTIVSKLDPAIAPATSTGPQPLPPASSTSFTSLPPAKPLPSRRSLWMIGAGLAVITCLAAALIVGRLALSGMNSIPPEPTQTVPAASETSAPTQEAVPIALSTETLAPTEMPTDTPTVTATLPPLYVRINGITVNDTGNYIVEYETFGYTPVLPGMHIHFIFNTVPLEQAGSPGSGPWYLYGGPSPFTKYREIDRPADATQMCAFVANGNHSVIPESGNCFNLP